MSSRVIEVGIDSDDRRRSCQADPDVPNSIGQREHAEKKKNLRNELTAEAKL